jgi:homocysteine S-methyltransferase
VAAVVDSPLTRALERDGLLVLDGALATELERHGADLSGGLWSARLLVEQPELISRVHRSYFQAGADVAITASYQASVDGFARAGVPASEAADLIRLSVSLAVQAREDFWETLSERDRQHRSRPLVATSVGPYGAVLADGSEYRGHYDLPYGDLVRFHRERLHVLAAAGVEVLACETIPSLVEARALVEVLGDFPDLSAWISFSARSDTEVSDGTPVAECAAFLADQDQVVAVGVNCTGVRHITPLIEQIGRATDKPVVVYPNSGEVYDAEAQGWSGDRATVDFGQLAAHWHDAGARLIGGCCRTRPDDIEAVARVLRGTTTRVEES